MLLVNPIYDKLKNNLEVSEEDYVSFLTESSALYYQGENFLSDDEFDFFKKNFIEKYGYNPVGVGTKEGLKGFSKAKHSIPMGSLIEFDTSRSVVEDIKKWCLKYSNKDEYCVSEKLDGLSVSVKWDKGVLVQALTRGDGFEGDDITSNVRKISRVPNKLPIEFSGFLRGEIILRKSVKQKYFSDMANERNAAVGITKRKNGEGCEHLDILFYKAYPDNPELYNFKLENEIIDFIKKDLKLFTPRYYVVGFKTLIALHAKYEESARDKLDYLLDGLVVNVNDIAHQHKITHNDLLPEYARKFKFESEKANTELLLVRNQVGRTGAITPLAILEPVVCGGTLISKATLHNYDEIKRLGLAIGDIVTVVRSKDVIPKIVGVAKKGEIDEKIPLPEVCPVCSSKLEKEDTLYFCRNEYCTAKTSKMLLHWLNVLGIKNIGEKLVEALQAKGKLKTIPDFYKLTVEDIASLDRQGVKNATKIITELNSKKEITLAKLLAGINIRNLSIKRAEILEDNFHTVDKIIKIKTSDIVALDGFEGKLASYIVTGIKSKSSLIKELQKFIVIKEKSEGILSGKSFCFSGFRDPNLSNEIISKGGRVSESFSKKISYLVVKNKNSTTTKLKKAEQYGIPVLDLRDLEGIIKNTLF